MVADNSGVGLELKPFNFVGGVAFWQVWERDTIEVIILTKDRTWEFDIERWDSDLATLHNKEV